MRRLEYFTNSFTEDAINNLGLGYRPYVAFSSVDGLIYSSSKIKNNEVVYTASCQQDIDSTSCSPEFTEEQFFEDTRTGILKFPSDATSVGGFEYSPNLNSVILPDSVTTINSQAFLDSSLSSITIPENSVITISDNAFYGCDNLTSIQLPQSLESIGDYAFASCTSLKKIIIPDGVHTIGASAFDSCSNLASIYVGASVNSIGNKAFSGHGKIVVSPLNETYDSRNDCDAIIHTSTNKLVCGNSRSIIPDDVVSIGKNAFNREYDLPSIVIPDSVKTIESGAFMYCNKVTHLDLGSVVTLESSAFYGLSSLTEFEIPDSVTTIGQDAFGGCGTVNTVTIGKNLKSGGGMGTHIFMNTTINSLKWNVTNYGNIASTLYSPFYSCKVKELVVGNNVTNLPRLLCYNHSELGLVDIGTGIKALGERIFYGCSGLRTIICRATTPPTIDSASVLSTVTKVYVPSTSVNAYKSKTGWSGFGTKIQAIPDSLL